MKSTAIALSFLFFACTSANAQHESDKTSAATATDEFLVYAPSRSSGTLIVVGARNTSGGLKLSVRQTVKLGFPASTIVRNPDERCLYVAAAKTVDGEQNTGAVVKLDKNGLYESHSPVSFRHGYCYLSLDRTKRFLLGVEYSGGHVDVYSIDDHGIPGKCVSSLDEGRRNAHCVLPSPDNNSVYIPYVKDTNALFQYSFDADTGKLSANEPKNAEPPKGTGPRHLACHPDKPIVYFSNEQLPGASVYAITNSGTLEIQQVCRAFDEQQDLAGLSSSDIAITPDGRYVFVGVRGLRRNLDRIAGFRVKDNGNLELLGLTEADGVPWGITLSPDGKYLLVSAFKGATLTAYAIREDGRLTVADQLQWDQQISDLVAGQ